MPSASSPSPASIPAAKWLHQRATGVLTHPTSFPGEYGVGSFDTAANEFIDFLAESGVGYWQVCPLGPTGYGDSPYQCFSSFAGNPYMVDVKALVDAGLLVEGDVAPLRALSADQVDFGALYRLKLPILFAAHARWRMDPTRPLPYGDFGAFRETQATWLTPYGLFSALKDHFEGQPWWEWPVDVKTLPAAAKSPLRTIVAARAEAYEFLQYLFFGQWNALRARAADRGIKIIGDTPIFTALDSADVWASPQLFQLDRKTMRPLAVAGVPPDYFSVTGQYWGNPLYDWPVHAAEGYAWWIDRLRANFALCDVVRIDHFRGFDSFWSIPAGSPDATTGQWVKGPGMDFFRAFHAAMPEARLIAEDLGLLTPDVVALRDGTGLPGMSILQFAFGGDAENLYLPHNDVANCVIYPGTHDNDTTRGWYAHADEKARDHVRRYLRISGEDIAWDFVRAAYASRANLAVISLQDLFNLDSSARFNTPGQSQGNWQWRYRADDLRALRRNSSRYLRELAELYGRIPVVKASPA